MPSRLVNVKLNYQLIARILGFLLLIIAVSMVPAIICAHIYDERACSHALTITASVALFAGGVMALTIKPEKSKFRTREGYIVVASCWLIASLIGAFPYLLCGFAENYVDAFFEATAGFTTTGCSAISGVEMPKSMILWKATGNWLGGMGILVFVISILPALGVNGQFIARAESPGPVLQKSAVRMSDSAKALYLSYITLTVIEFCLLYFSGSMPAFDALTNTLGCVSTGGLTAHPEGIMYYDSLYVEIVISVIAFLASINFLLYHYLVSGKWKYLLKDIELRYFIIIIAGATAICTIGQQFMGQAETWGESLRLAFFQVTSMATTSGYSGYEYGAWPTVCQVVLVMVMFIGGCAASTSGSIKVIRVMVLLRLVTRGFYKRLHPRSIVPVKIGGKPMPAPIVSEITVFIIFYMLTFLGGALVISLQGLSMEASLSTSLAMLSNVGLAFGEVAEMGNYAMFSDPIKVFMSLLMIIGRLELFPIIILFTRNFWGRDR